MTHQFVGRRPGSGVAGSEDRRTPLEESKALFRAAGHPKDLWVVNGAAHQSFHRFAGAEYERRLLEFFDEEIPKQLHQPGGTFVRLDTEKGQTLLLSCLLEYCRSLEDRIDALEAVVCP